jgi:sugar diacid utilization regulator
MLADLQSLVEGLAARLGRGVAIDDSNFRLIVHTAHHGPVDRTRLESILRMRPPDDVLAYMGSMHYERMTEDVTRLEAVASLGMLARVLAPIRSGGHLFGFLSLIDADESLTEREFDMVVEVARSAASIMERDSLMEDLRAGRQRELVRDVLSADAALRESAAQELEGVEGGLSGPVQALIVQIRPGELTQGRDLSMTVESALDRAARRSLARQCLYLSRGHHGLIVVPVRGLAGRDVRRLAEAARREVSSALHVVQLRSAVGDPVERVAELAHSYDQAQSALRVAELVTTFGPHVAWSQLGVYRTLVHLPVDLVPTDLLPTELLGLFDDSAGTELLRTVEVYLDEAGDVRRTIARLSIHRTSLYYRLRRFSEVTGLDLNDGGQRLSIHLGLKLARLRGISRYLLPDPTIERDPVRREGQDSTRV